MSSCCALVASVDVPSGKACALTAPLRAGRGADAKPFLHMLDLTAESARFDPDGHYVRRWLPVLSRMPAKWIHRCACPIYMYIYPMSPMPGLELLS